jgi:23S rRNA (cytidine2498-2'-O)-methyltransferase
MAGTTTSSNETELFTYVLTASSDFLHDAIDEIRQADPSLYQIMEPDEEIAVVESGLDLGEMHRALQRAAPIFLRHIAPAQSRVILSGSGNDLGELARATLALPEIEALGPGDSFSVQARVITGSGEERPYSPYAIKAAIAPLIETATRAREDVRAPDLVVSVLVLPALGLVGLSPVQFNLSDWSGGERRFARTSEQVSRSEFKLLEALEVFGVDLQEGTKAVDLGAAPGGWTRVLVEYGVEVTAVDPAELHPSIRADRRVEIVRGHAQEWIERAASEGHKFDVIVSDIRMDARDAARLVVDAAPLMHLDSLAILTLKLPGKDAQGMNPVAIAREALEELRSRYRTVHARQLFHNRNEVTVYIRP